MTNPSASSPTPSSAPQQGEKSGYRATLNLPKTSFPMKASLVQNEPASQKRWAAIELYNRVQQARAGRPRFVFHDGPPYANGSIHLGHMLNKCLKDFVVRARVMAGRDCPYVPGWDCHGLPIEHKVMTELVESGKAAKLAGLPVDQRQMAVRRECRKYAEKYVKLQAGQMQRLLTLADYEHPYLTMAPEFEGATLEALAALMEQGLVYRALKPVHWSIANETALADAELEYYDREDISVYVDFEAEDAGAVYDAFGLKEGEANAEDAEGTEEGEEGDEEEAGAEGEGGSAAPVGRPTVRPSFMIWTTTPWTLPANLAIAVHPDIMYALVFVDGNIAVMAEGAIERVTAAAKAEDVKVLGRAKGFDLVGLRYRHPFVPKAAGAPPAVFTVVAADYVTLEDGTGLVHTAPGHGQEDFQTGKRVGLPIYCPVQGNGTYDDTVPEFLRGMSIWKANELIVQTLRESGHLFYDHKFVHSYPHDWRGKSPVIFRCTEQWFVGVDQPTKRDQKSLRGLGLAWVSAPVNAGPIEGVKFVPEWGRNRMRGMLESRPDWCISRQRAWGLPIPAFFTADGRVFMTPASVRAVAKLVREKGSDAWFMSAPAELLKYYDPAGDPDRPEFVGRDSSALAALQKGPDILDVWFESGSSWNAVMRERSGGRDFPCDLYLEGSDQHRGWFQTSLLPSLGMMGRPPYRTLLTHGFMVDKDGKKMSKSLGNTLEVEDLLKDYGADVCRWWVASLSYENDIKVDKSYFDIAGESYRKVRNTLRFMLSNLDDLDAAAAERAAKDPAGFPPTSIDAWVLGEYDKMAAAAVEAYGAYDFQTVHKLVYDFCNDTLSARYLAAIKDRMYCDRVDSARRRRTQTALLKLTDGLCRLLAPLMPHTADEAYRALWKAGPEDPRSVQLETFITGTGASADPAWAKAVAALEPARVALEGATTAEGKKIDPIDLGVVLPDPEGALGRFDPVDLADLLGVSRLRVDPGAAAVAVQDLRNEPQCERSWKRDGTVKRRSDGGLLTDRDAAAIGVS